MIIENTTKVKGCSCFPIPLSFPRVVEKGIIGSNHHLLSQKSEVDFENRPIWSALYRKIRTVFMKL